MRFLRMWGRNLVVFGLIVGLAGVLTTGVSWAAGELFSKPWDSVVVIATYLVVFSLVVTLLERKRRS